MHRETDVGGSALQLSDLTSRPPSVAPPCFARSAVEGRDGLVAPIARVRDRSGR